MQPAHHEGTSSGCTKRILPKLNCVRKIFTDLKSFCSIDRTSRPHILSTYDYEHGDRALECQEPPASLTHPCAESLCTSEQSLGTRATFGAKFGFLTCYISNRIWHHTARSALEWSTPRGMSWSDLWCPLGHIHHVRCPTRPRDHI